MQGDDGCLVHSGLFGVHAIDISDPARPEALPCPIEIALDPATGAGAEGHAENWNVCNLGWDHLIYPAWMDLVKESRWIE